MGGLTNFPYGISSFGIPVIGNGIIPTTFGNYWFVDYDYGSDGNTGKSMKKAFKTIAKAYSMTRDGYDDVIILSGYSAHTLTAMLTVSNSKVHFVGLDAGLRRYGQGARVDLGLSTTATDIANVLVTGSRCSFTNIKFRNTNTYANNAYNLYTFIDAGEYTRILNCEFYKENYLDQTAAAEFVANGDSGQYINCTFGSIANAQTGNIIRPSVLVTKGIGATSAVARDVSFINCLFWKSAGHVNGRHVYGANATDVERMMLFDRCIFVNSKIAAAVPAQCVGFGSSLTVGQVLMNNCSSINNTKLSTTTGVYLDGGAPSTTATGVSVQSA